VAHPTPLQNELALSPGAPSAPMPAATTSREAPGTAQERIEDLKRRIAVSQEECDALRSPGREEDYLRACSMIEALELQLEASLRPFAG